MTASPLSSWNASRDSVFSDGELLRIVRGEFRGKIVRVNGTHSFWTPETFYEGDPSKGRVSPEGWQIVLDIEVPEKGWLYFLRESEEEVLRYVERIPTKVRHDIDAGERKDFEERVAASRFSGVSLFFYPDGGETRDPSDYSVADLLDLALEAEETGTGQVVDAETGEILFEALAGPDGSPFCVDWVAVLLFPEGEKAEDERRRNAIRSSLRYGRSISDVREVLRSLGVNLNYSETIDEAERLGFVVENLSKTPGRNRNVVVYPSPSPVVFDAEESLR